MKNCLYLMLSILCLSCSTTKNIGIRDSLILIVESEEFRTNFRLCDKKNDTIKIYKNVDQEIEKYSKLICGKAIIIENSNLTIDVKKPTRFDDEKIILYKLESHNNNQVFTFLNNHSNMNLKISIDNRNRIKVVERGFF